MHKHPVGFSEYLVLSWLAASLEDEGTLRQASYGYRQRRRHENDGHGPAKQ